MDRGDYTAKIGSDSRRQPAPATEDRVATPGDPSPIVFHFNSSKWRKHQAEAMAAVRRSARHRADFGSVGGTPELEIITCNSRNERTLTQQWLDEMGIPYHWLGRGTRHWRNSLKISLCAEFLQDVSSPYVLHLDADDVLVSAPPAEILRRFEACSCDMLFNAEAGFYFHDCPGFGSGRLAALGFDICRHHLSCYLAGSALRRSAGCCCTLHGRARLHNVKSMLRALGCGKLPRWPRTDRFTYLNAGCWIGGTAFLRTAFAELRELLATIGPFGNDQPYMHILHYRRFPRIRIDHQCRIFQCGTLCHDRDFFLPAAPSADQTADSY